MIYLNILTLIIVSITLYSQIARSNKASSGREFVACMYYLSCYSVDEIEEAIDDMEHNCGVDSFSKEARSALRDIKDRENKYEKN